MSVIGSNILAGASGQGGYFLTNSLRFRNSASAYLSRTPSSSGDTQKFTYSAWVKLGQLSMSGGNYLFSAVTSATTDAIRFTSGNTLQFFLGGAGTAQLVSTAVYRDPSAWYHVVVAVDTTQATASNRVRMYVNGVEITSFSTANYPSQNTNCAAFNVSGKLHTIANDAQLANYGDEYLTEVNFVNAQQLTPSSFGETSTSTGVWIPKKYTGTYGTNGFYLPFTNTASTSTLGNDFSGNSNTWTVNNISLTAGSTYDSMTDVPTLTSATAANYCVLSPIARGTQANGTITGGNLNLSTTTSDTRTYATFGFPTSGKYYWELTNNNSGSKGQGIASVDANGDTYHVLYFGDGNKQVDGTNTSYGASYTTNDVIGVAVDIDNNQITFYKNGTSQGAISYTFSSRPTMFPYVRREASTDASYSFNFGQRPFSYTPPTGFVRLNTFNLPTPTIGATASTQANDYFDVVTRNGFGSSGGSVTSLNFQPDFWWEKARSTASNHTLIDSIRGVTKELYSNLTNAESTGSNFLTSFNSNGFTMGSNDWGTSTTLVDWVWKAGGTAVTNTAGSITSSVSANTTAGFSIVTYTGNGTSSQTCGHGLGVTPAMVIWKNRNDVDAWIVYHSALTTSEYLILNTTAAKATFSGLFTGISSTVLPLNNASAAINANGFNYVAYCFAPIAGYSAFGSYTGNGSSDGTFVYTGFRPRFVMMKASSNSTSSTVWTIFDTSRSPYNASVNELYPNLSAAEGVDSSGIDILSNGFKPKRNSEYANFSGWTYIYMAFAETPLKFSNAR